MRTLSHWGRFLGLSSKTVFACVATGLLYGRAEQYINALYGMLSEHFQRPFELRCYTDRPRAIDERIRQMDCTSWREFQAAGTHPTDFKLGLFNPDYAQCDELFYLDLSLIIQSDLTPLVDYAGQCPEGLVIVKDWFYDGYNSSVMRIKPREMKFVYDDYVAGIKYPMHIAGDQDYIHGATQLRPGVVTLFPAGHVESFKRLIRAGMSAFGAVKASAEQAMIIKFHGRPKMHVLFASGYVFFKYRLRYMLHGHWRLPVDVSRLRRAWLGSEAR